jgi:hypothetical protein
MLRMKSNPKLVVAVAYVSFLGGLMLYGCSTSSTPPATSPAPSASDIATTQPVFALFGPPPVKSGVQLWSENCMRCHNGRPPDEFSDAQWETIVQHMRLRANLTGEEAREITKFLKASN